VQEEAIAAGRARFLARARRLADRALRLEDAAAVQQLADMGAAAVQLLIDRMPDRPDGAATVLDAVLTQMDRAGTLAVLRDLTLEDRQVRALLVDPHAVARRATVRILGCTGDLRWTRLLGRVLREDPDPLVRSATVEALARLGSPDVLDDLSSSVEGARDDVRYDTIRAIGGLGPAGCWYLVALAVEHPHEQVRTVAAETLARCADVAAWESLLSRLRSARCHDVRRTLVEGFGRSRAVRTARVLVRALIEDESPIVRQAAADALPLLRDPRVMGALVDSALYDSYSEPDAGEAPKGSPTLRYPVREAAAEALLVLGGTEALESLEHVPSLVTMTI
jgi:HEAT repeat protein